MREGKFDTWNATSPGQKFVQSLHLLLQCFVRKSILILR